MKNKPPFIDKHHCTWFVPFEQKHLQVTIIALSKYKPMSEVSWMQSNSLSVPTDHLQLLLLFIIKH